jgi:hypothetical protein
MWKGVKIGQTLKGDHFEDFLTGIYIGKIEEIAVEACPPFS